MMTAAASPLFDARELSFMSGGTRCAVRLYLPSGVAKPPVVVMAHGIAGEREFRLPAFAERFAAAGLAVLLFDYRNFGASDGEPRNLVDWKRHLEDWRAAVRFARALPDVDGSRVALWGTSFSGGHVIVTAARDGTIAAVVAQVPFVDGPASASLFPVSYQLDALRHGLADVAREALGLSPHTIPVVSFDGGFALLNSADAEKGYRALVPEGYPFANAVPARILLTLPFYRPSKYAARIKCPVLLMGAADDTLIPIKAVEAAAKQIRNCTYVRLPMGHFAPYVGEPFEAVVKQQTEFLVKELGAARSVAG